MNQIGRNDACWCGSGRKYKKCHENFDHKLNLLHSQGLLVPSHKLIKTEAQIAEIRKSAEINVKILDYVAEHIKEGISTAEIDKWVYDITTKEGAIPAPLGYEGFPKSVCTSINNVVCHGIPSENEILVEGDIINVDVSTILNGYYSDSSRMFCIGDVGEEKARLVRVAKECVEKGLEQVKAWGFLGDMSQAVHEHAVKNGYSVVREIGGHGVGLEFHEDPWVGYIGAAGTGMVMAPGLMFTIEPMVNMGTDEIFVDERDGWTIYTEDDMPSAQWEIMVLVTENGPEVIAW